MKYVLDSDSVSFLYNQNSSNYLPFLKKILECPEDDRVCISLLTLFELDYSYYNAPKSKRDNIKNMIRSIKRKFEILPLSETVSSIYGQLKSLLRRSRKIKPQNMKKYNIDLIIAATTVSEDGVLISNDRIYQSLSELHPKLKVENWTL